MLAGSFFLTPATALRYERHDQKMRRLDREEELGVGRDRRKVDIREEYYVGRSWPLFEGVGGPGADVVGEAAGGKGFG